MFSFSFTESLKKIGYFIVLYVLFYTAHAEQSSLQLGTQEQVVSQVTEQIANQNEREFDPQMVTDQIESEPEQSYYQIDLVLFEHRSDSGMQSEVWSREAMSDFDDNHNEILAEQVSDSSNSKKTISRSPAMASYNLATHKFRIYSRDFVALSSENHLLREEFTRIKNSSRYGIITYMAWIQPGLSPKSAKSIEILEPFARDGETLSGRIKIILSRYLHAHIDLVSSRQVCVHNNSTKTTTESNAATNNDPANEAAFNPEQAANAQVSETNQEQPLKIRIDTSQPQVSCSSQDITFKQSRKMRSRELHYIDNPGFGILMMITPVEKPENEAFAPQQPSEEPQEQQVQQIDIESASIFPKAIDNALLYGSIAKSA